MSLDPGEIDLEVLKAELQLVAIKPLGTPAKLVALELLHDQPQPLDLGLRLGRAVRSTASERTMPLQRLHIVRQSGKIDVHARDVR